LFDFQAHDFCHWRWKSVADLAVSCSFASGKLPIIGSGGIFDADDAYEKIRF
jgi:dihydroorotate dehydrogenase